MDATLNERLDKIRSQLNSKLENQASVGCLYFDANSRLLKLCLPLTMSSKSRKLTQQQPPTSSFWYVSHIKSVDCLAFAIKLFYSSR